MQTVLIVIHLLIVLALVVVVLLQRSEGGALGMGGGGGGGLMTARGAGNFLTRTTAILATGFFITSLGLGILARYESSPLDILDRVPASQSGAPGAAPVGNLLDELGGLPDAPAEPGPIDVPAGATPSAPVTTLPAPVAPPQNAGDVPLGSSPLAAPSTDVPADAVPANPGDDTPAAQPVPTVPPVEAPPAGSDASPAAGGTTPSTP